MDKGLIQAWAERFAADLTIGGERVPLDRVISAHLAELQDLRANGLTWRGIAAIITRAGGRRANGMPISADQLRADMSRLLKRRVDRTETVLASGAPIGTARPAVARATSPPPQSRSTKSPAASPSSQASAAHRLEGSKDVSHDDIAAALARLQLRS